jgi:hypothetical protein
MGQVCAKSVFKVSVHFVMRGRLRAHADVQKARIGMRSLRIQANNPAMSKRNSVARRAAVGAAGLPDTSVVPASGHAELAQRVRALDWQRISRDLDNHGNAMIESALTPFECQIASRWYTDDSLFRSRVVMSRHGFGRGEYKYFSYPLPQVVTTLREAFYRQLAPLANRWNEQLRVDVRYPSAHPRFLARCRDAGQTLPTPLLLKYEVGDYNCLHRDLYGECVFPLQLTILLSQPGRDFTGGDFILTEQRPRMQSRAEIVPLRQGDAVIFAVYDRPVSGTRGVYRVHLRHGVSRVRSGHRYTLGVIFHDAT